MKIVVITSEPLREIPPVSTLLQVISSGNNCEVICITFAKENALDKYSNISNLYIKRNTIQYVNKSKNRLSKSFAFRVEKIAKTFCAHLIPLRYRKVLKDADIIWIAHENVFRFGGNFFLSKLPPFIFTMYELQLNSKNDRKIFKRAAKKSLVLVSPEYCRAHIMRAIYSRADLPDIVPNKPINHPQTSKMIISDPRIRERIDSIEASNRKIIMYMGIISDERPLEPIIEAVECVRDKYEFVVLGDETNYLKDLLRRYDSFTYLGSVTPPQHLEIASHANIAYVIYVPRNNSINAVFCAPNKVYEFAGFGIPMLCNDVPGLKYIVETNGMGICLSNLDKKSIINAIFEIEKNYEELHMSALSYYQSEDVSESVFSVLDEYMVKRNKSCKKGSI